MIEDSIKNDSDNIIQYVKPALVFGLSVIAVVVLVSFAWTVFAPIESAAIATGTIVPATQRKTIQHLEGGIIEEILVQEGDVVKPGQPLVLLNDTVASSRQQMLRGQLLAAKAVEARLQAERDNQTVVMFDKEVFANIEDPVIATMVDTQKRLFKTRQEVLYGQTDVLKQRIAQFEDQVAGLEAQYKSVDDQLALITEETGIIRDMLEKGLAHKPRLLELERRGAELEGQKGQIRAQEARIAENITETQLQILNLRNERLKEVVAELKEVQQEIGQVQEELYAAEDALRRTQVAAPIAGIVTDVKYHTIGGVVGPGAPIMDIVPQEDRLIVEARVQPADIDVVHKGLSAKVMLTPYKSRFLPRLQGDVIHVSADSLVDEHTGHSYYIARIELHAEELAHLAADVRLYPGMPVNVFIVTGRRSFASYLMSPITDSFQKAFRES